MPRRKRTPPPADPTEDTPPEFSIVPNDPAPAIAPADPAPSNTPTDPEDDKRAKEAERARKRYAVKKRQAEDVETARELEPLALMVITAIEAIAAQFAGPDAAMMDKEREAIADPLKRILARLPAEQLEVIQKYSDPLALLTGLGAYGFRVWRIYDDTQQQHNAALLAGTPTEQRPQPEDASIPNG
jgi:hypothetical protein